MKKIFTLFVAMAFMATSFAQVSVQTGNFKESPFNGKLIQKSVKSAEEGWISTYAYLENYWGENSVVGGSSNYLQVDSTGLVLFGDEYSHPWFYSVSQTFDFESNFWDLASSEGDLSLVSTNSFSIDSLAILAGYFREPNYPAGAVDTMIVGVMTDLIENETPVYSYTNYENTCFYYFEIDRETSLPVGAQIFKVPLDETFISEEAEDGGYYLTEIDVPVNLTNVTGKVWNIAYTFKPGYTVGMNDTLPSDFHFSTWASPDPYYAIDANNPEICSNLSHGQFNCSFTNGDIDYYYPAFAFGGSSQFHYPRMYVKVACNDCKYVAVEEMEKENLTVYPNPAHNYFKVELAGDSKANIQLFNLVGQQVYSETASNVATINTSNLKAGIYMLKVSQDGKVYTSKVVVK